MTSEVQLAVYDLSHGMARSLSAQFLGPNHAIDIIPHTAIIVFGQEFFFGGGIQHEDPQRFRQTMGINPVQILSLGRTSVSRAQFEQWCQQCTHSGRYGMASYDLLNHNCNNFSHDAAVEGLKLPQGVPQWILDVPRTFLSSPMGQMIRPMLENMQVGGGMGGGNSGMAAPFATAPTSQFASTVPTTTTTSNGNAAAANPWASIPAPQKSLPKEPTTKQPANSNINKGTPVLDSFCKPLLSSDSKTIALCIKKIVDHLQDADDTDKQTMESIGQTLAKQQKLTSEQVQQGCQIIHSKVFLQSATAGSTTITFSLMLLRVIILQSTGSELAARECLQWIASQLNPTGTASGAALTSHAARAMAWLTLSNAASLAWWQVPLVEESIMEAAFADWTAESQPRAEVRQAAAAFCYNWVLRHDDQQQPSNSSSNDDETMHELSDDRVSLLCASLESIAEEPDGTTKLRRLLVAARILVPLPLSNSTTTTTKKVCIPAKNLMQDLAFPEAIEEVANQSLASDAQKLAKEMLYILQEY